MQLSFPALRKLYMGVVLAVAVTIKIHREMGQNDLLLADLQALNQLSQTYPLAGLLLHKCAQSYKIDMASIGITMPVLEPPCPKSQASAVDEDPLNTGLRKGLGAKLCNKKPEISAESRALVNKLEQGVIEASTSLTSEHMSETLGLTLQSLLSASTEYFGTADSTLVAPPELLAAHTQAIIQQSKDQSITGSLIELNERARASVHHPSASATASPAPPLLSASASLSSTTSSMSFSSASPALASSHARDYASSPSSVNSVDSPNHSLSFDSFLMDNLAVLGGKAFEPAPYDFPFAPVVIKTEDLSPSGDSLAIPPSPGGAILHSQVPSPLLFSTSSPSAHSISSSNWLSDLDSLSSPGISPNAIASSPDPWHQMMYTADQIPQ
jgi:hypothetical protein